MAVNEAERAIGRLEGKIDMLLREFSMRGEEDRHWKENLSDRMEQFDAVHSKHDDYHRETRDGLKQVQLRLDTIEPMVSYACGWVTNRVKIESWVFAKGSAIGAVAATLAATFWDVISSFWPRGH